jgi:hypothetical protein
MELADQLEHGNTDKLERFKTVRFLYMQCLQSKSGKPSETEQISTPPKRGRRWNGFKAFIQVAYRITIKSFWDSVMNK